MAKKNFLFLLALTQANPKLGVSALEKIRRLLDPSASPAWIDSRGVGIFLATDLPVHEVWRLSIPELKTHADRQSMRDVLILELGTHHLGFPETKGMAWLNSHATVEHPPES